MNSSKKKGVTRQVSNRTWGVIMSLTLVAVGAKGVWALATSGEWWWLQLAAFALGVLGLVDAIRRWEEI